MEGKRVIVIASRGSLDSEGPAKAIDFQEPYLRQLLGFMELTDVAFIHAQKIDFGPDAREAALSAAKGKISATVAEALTRAG